MKTSPPTVMRSGCISRRRGSSGCSLSICCHPFALRMAIHLDHETGLVPDMFVRVRSPIATQPAIQCGASGMLVSLGQFFFGPRGRIADAAAVEFVSARLEFARDGRRPLLPPLARVFDELRGLYRRFKGLLHYLLDLKGPLRHPLHPKELIEQITKLFRRPRLCDRGLDMLDIDAEPAPFQVPRDVNSQRVPRFSLLHG